MREGCECRTDAAEIPEGAAAVSGVNGSLDPNGPNGPNTYTGPNGPNTYTGPNGSTGYNLPNTYNGPNGPTNGLGFPGFSGPSGSFLDMDGGQFPLDPLEPFYPSLPLDVPENNSYLQAIQQERENLQQIDTLLLSGVGSPRVCHV